MSSDEISVWTGWQEPNSIVNGLANEVCAAWPVQRWRDCGVLVGCSGGADSVGLAVLLAQLRLDPAFDQGATGFFRLVHVNHALRGEESDADERSVKELSSRLGIEFKSVRLDGSATDEATLRMRRESLFAELAHAAGARYVAVGHTADDNAETLLHQLFRGTGPAGLAAIAPFRPLGSEVVLARPLLGVRRAAIRDMLRQIGIPWREDSSNEDTRYTRNWIRHELFPLVESRYPGATERVANAASLQRDWRKVVDKLAAQWLSDHVRSITKDCVGVTDRILLLRDALSESSIVIAALQQLWREARWPRMAMTVDHWQRIAQTIATSAASRYSLPGNIDVIGDADTVELSRCKC